MIAIDKKFYEGVCALINGGADVNDEDIFHHFFYEISICLILQYFKFFEMEFFFMLTGHHFIMLLKLVMQELLKCF